MRNPAVTIGLLIALLFLCGSATAETIIGIYGVPVKGKISDEAVAEMGRAGVTAVFVPADAATIRWFTEKGFTVFIAVNAFGGSGAWREFPDSRPVLADGTLMKEGHGSGVCPAHEGVRKKNMASLRKLVADHPQISGVFIDFIRYPGLWEVPDPRVPDTCYCPRCLSAFRRDTGVSVPAGMGAKEAAAWIAAHYGDRWTAWKIRQIASYAEEVRNAVGKDMTIGAFVVPWRQDERKSAVLRLLAQDVTLLSQYFNAVSPMVYHKMVNEPASWIENITSYMRGISAARVWPIVQSVDISAEEFCSALASARAAHPDGLLVYSYSGLDGSKWRCLK